MKHIKNNYKINISNNLDSYFEVWDVNLNCKQPNIIQTRWREDAKCTLEHFSMCLSWFTHFNCMFACGGCNWVLDFLA